MYLVEINRRRHGVLSAGRFKSITQSVHLACPFSSPLILRGGGGTCLPVGFRNRSPLWGDGQECKWVLLCPSRPLWSWPGSVPGGGLRKLISGTPRSHQSASLILPSRDTWMGGSVFFRWPLAYKAKPAKSTQFL